MEAYDEKEYCGYCNLRFASHERSTVEDVKSGLRYHDRCWQWMQRGVQKPKLQVLAGGARECGGCGEAH